MLRCQCERPERGTRLTTPVWTTVPKTTPYDPSAAKDAPDGNENLEMTHAVTGLRPERGYSATKYAGNAANPQKTVRPQFGRFYDEKKVRNSELSATAWIYVALIRIMLRRLA